MAAEDGGSFKLWYCMKNAMHVNVLEQNHKELEPKCKYT
jgi:hypothetical protein